ncbi:MAG: cobalamin-binding protein [Chloroflexota bacterium]|nr:cobalamin-binding protein [Chloroflexota bacterium]
MVAAFPRIVSLLPSATEIVCALGLGEALVGVSHECDWPPFVRTLPILTSAAIPTGLPSGETDRLVRERLARGEGLYALDAVLMRELRPTLIVTQALCEVCSIALPEVLRAARTLPTAPPVVSLEPGCIADIFADMERVAAIAGVPERAAMAVGELQERLDAVHHATAGRERPRAALLEWLDPPFVAGHWGPEMIAIAGGTDTLGVIGEKSAQIHWEQLREAAPEVIVVAPCGYDTARARADLADAPLPPWWDDLPAVRNGRVFVMDGNAHISRPGPRIVDGTELLACLLHPDAFADGAATRERHRVMVAAVGSGR